MTQEEYDSSNPKHVKSAKKQQKLLDERFRNGMEKICADVEMRHVLNQFFEEMSVFHDAPSIPTPDYIFEQGRYAGKKSAGLWFLNAALLHDPDIIAKLESDKVTPIRVRSDQRKEKT